MDYYEDTIQSCKDFDLEKFLSVIENKKEDYCYSIAAGEKLLSIAEVLNNNFSEPLLLHGRAGDGPAVHDVPAFRKAG